MPTKSANPPATKTIRRRGPKLNLRVAVRNWLLANDAVESFTKQVTEHKKILMEALSEVDADDKGCSWLNFADDPIEGRIKGLKRERRVSRRLNEDRIEALLTKKGIYDDCTETIVVISEDKVMAKYWDGLITEKELEAAYDVSETFAFVPQRVKL